MHLKQLLAVAVVAALPMSASAVTMSQLDVVGNLNPSTSEYAADGQIDFVGPGFSTAASGIFSSVITIEEALGNPFDPTVFTLNDFAFDAAVPVLIYSGGGFSFFATAFNDFDSTPPGRAFSAVGFVTGPSQEFLADFALSTQVTDVGETLVSFSSTTTVVPVPASVLMLLAALTGLGLIAHRRRSDAT